MSNLNNRVNNLESNVGQILTLLQSLTGQSNEVETPKTSARIRQTSDDTAKMAKKGQKVDNVEIDITEARFNAGRVKLPARMFMGKYDSVTIEGHHISQCDSDQNRSLPFAIDLFGDISEGQTLVFSHEKGNRWNVEIEGKGRKGKAVKVSAKSIVPKGRKVSKSEDDDASSGKLIRSKGQKSAFAKVAEEFAQICIKNSRKGIINQNIQDNTTMAVDARIYLTTADNKRFRKAWKYQFGLKLTEATRILNSFVYED